MNFLLAPLIAKIGKPALMMLSIAAVALVAALIAYLAVAKFESIIASIGQEVRQERDAYWQLQISNANTRVAQAEAAQANATIAIQADASEKVRRAEQLYAERKKQNEALPNRKSCGLSRERVQLLPD